MKTSFIRFAVAAATVVSLGAPAAFAAKNQSATVITPSFTTVISGQTSLSSNTTVLNQTSVGGPSNKSATSNTSAVSAVGATINASSGNFVIVNQQ